MWAPIVLNINWFYICDSAVFVLSLWRMEFVIPGIWDWLCFLESSHAKKAVASSTIVTPLSLIQMSPEMAIYTYGKSCIWFRGTNRLFPSDGYTNKKTSFYASCTVNKKACCVFLLQSLQDFSKNTTLLFCIRPIRQKNPSIYLQWQRSNSTHMVL